MSLMHRSVRIASRHVHALALSLPPGAPKLPLHATTGAGHSDSGPERVVEWKVPRQRSRTPAEHVALVAALQRELHTSVAPPEDAYDWPRELLWDWMAGGGELSVAALAAAPPCDASCRLIDEIGADWPVVPLPVLELDGGGSEGAFDGGGGVSHGTLAALAAGAPSATAPLAASLAARGCAACTLLEADAAPLAELRGESTRAWPRMRPGELRSQVDGSLVVGRSPSGALRGDRYVQLRELIGSEPNGGDEDAHGWPALAASDAALATVGAAVGAQLEAQGAAAVARRSDTFVATFVGDGLGYNAHLDGDELTRLTMILYCGGGDGAWEASHGGTLRMLDEERRCWWEAAPRAGTLVLFRADRVLHKVQPCHAPRHALTMWLSAAPPPVEEHERSAVLASLSGMV